MNLGSMERTLTTKSIRLQEISQWTAAATLIAAGSLALFSASTLEKLSNTGDVSIDFTLFQKIGNTSLRFDRLDSAPLLNEEKRISKAVEIATAEPLPASHTRFQRIRTRSNRPEMRVAVGDPIHLTQSDALEIAQLEKVSDRMNEQRTFAGIYRGLRAQFFVAVERLEPYDPKQEVIATAPLPTFKKKKKPQAEVTVEALPDEGLLVKDTVEFSVSSAQSKSETDFKTLNEDENEDKNTEVLTKVLPISTPGLDLVPEPVLNNLNTHHEAYLDIQKLNRKESTGPPVRVEALNPNLFKSSDFSEVIKDGHTLGSRPVQEITAEDSLEYSKDIYSIYQSPTESEYPNTQATHFNTPNSSSSITIHSANQAVPVKPKAKNLTQATAKNESNKSRDFGHGVHRDDGGITINWDERNPQAASVYVGKPFERSPEAVVPSKKEKAEPVVDTKKCETSLVGVEAFNPGTEKETLSICRRALSFEGFQEGQQARWWESYENQGEYWPTLSYLRPDEISSKNRIPMLSTASIRILSAVSKTNTHTGTGILFGEVKKGIEIQLLGRTDPPTYMDQEGLRQFIFLNVEPGQPILIVKNSTKRNAIAALPIIVKSGMATHLKIGEPKEVDLDITIFDASSAKESRLSNLTASVVGQPGKMGITDRNGNVKIKSVGIYGDFPVYLDVLKSEKNYKNRYRVNPRFIGNESENLYFFDEKRVDQWISQLAGGLSPHSGLVAGVTPRFTEKVGASRYFKIGILEKKSSLIPERYFLDRNERLISSSEFKENFTRYVGVQIPEGTAIPTVVDETGNPVWSELVYAQPGVINVIRSER